MSDLDDILTRMTDGLPLDRLARYELRPAPDVRKAIVDAAVAEPPQWPPVPPGTPGAFGAADVVVDESFDPGCWEILRDGVSVKKTVRGPDGTLYEITQPEFRIPPFEFLERCRLLP